MESSEQGATSDVSKPKPKVLTQELAKAIWKSADGNSALYRGDCFEIMAAMAEASVDCIWTDPPYNLSNDGITCAAGRMVKVNKGVIAICPAGPPKLMKPSLSQKRKASAKETLRFLEQISLSGAGLGLALTGTRHGQ